MIDDIRGTIDYDASGAGPDHGAGSRIVQHRRRMAADDGVVERRVPVRDYEPAGLRRNSGTPPSRRPVHRPLGRGGGNRGAHGRRAGASGRAFFRRPCVARGGAAQAGAARQHRDAGTAGDRALTGKGRGRALPRVRADVGSLCGRLQQRRTECDRGHDRLLRRRRHFRLVAVNGCASTQLRQRP